jgi:hypothetical protein
VADIENFMAGGTDEQPLDMVFFLLEHGMKAVLVSTDRTDSELFFKGDFMNGFLHNFLLIPELLVKTKNIIFSIPVFCNTKVSGHMDSAGVRMH